MISRSHATLLCLTSAICSGRARSDSLSCPCILPLHFHPTIPSLVPSLFLSFSCFLFRCLSFHSLWETHSAGFHVSFNTRHTTPNTLSRSSARARSLYGSNMLSSMKREDSC